MNAAAFPALRRPKALGVPFCSASFVTDNKLPKTGTNAKWEESGTRRKIGMTWERIEIDFYCSIRRDTVSF